MKRILFIALALISVSCSTSQKTVMGPDGRPVPASITTPFRLRPYSELTLSNGLQVILVEDKALPYISFTVMIKSGAAMDPAAEPGLATFVAGLLDKGTKDHTAPQIADLVGDMGAELDLSVNYDFTMLQSSALASQQDHLLKIVSEVLTRPTFSEVEVNRYRKQLIASRQKLPDSANAFADRAFQSYLFGDEAYGRPANGTIKSLSTIRRKHIIQFYLQHYRPNNAAIAVVGQFTPDIKERLEAAFKGWQPRDIKPRVEQKASDAKAGIRLVVNPNQVQTQIVMGQKGIKRTDPDFLALRLGNTILGGSFISKLNDRIRVQLGLTYGISSVFDARLDQGPFQIATFTRNEKAVETIRETTAVVKNFVEQGVTEAEVASAKAYMVGTFPVAIETAEKLAFNLLFLRRHGIPDTYLSNFIQNINKLSVREVNEALRRHLDPQAMKVLVYSDRKILPELQKLGPVDVRNFTEIP